MCIGEQFTWPEAATVLAELGPHLAHPAHRPSRSILDETTTEGSRQGDHVTAKLGSAFLGSHQPHDDQNYRHR
jgi:hypothetical protein